MSNSDENKENRITYKQAGVDIEAGNRLVELIRPLAKSTVRPGADSQLGGFGGIFDLKSAGFKDPVLVAANDGVGTKLKIAIESDIHNTIGIDLVAMCVNDLIVQGAEPLFFLDYFSCAKLQTETVQQVISGIAEGCRQAGASLIGGETAEMPGLYREGDYDLAGFAVGAVERDALLPKPNITAGDIVIGLASAGAHSNGYSLIRFLIEKEQLDLFAPAPFQKDITLAEAVLTPTRIYVKSLLQLLKECPSVKGLAHITGGGITENVPRILPPGSAARIDLAAIKVPPIYRWISETGNMDQTELLRTFNCGVGMVAVICKTERQQAMACLENCGETVFEIGQIVTGTDTPEVVYSDSLDFGQ